MRSGGVDDGASVLVLAMSGQLSSLMVTGGRLVRLMVRDMVDSCCRMNRSAAAKPGLGSDGRPA